MIDFLESIPLEQRLMLLCIFLSCLGSIFVVQMFVWKQKERLEEIRKIEQKFSSMLGKTRKDVISKLGDPDDKGGTSRKYRTPSVFLYGNYEIHFGPRNKDPAWFVMHRLTHETIAKT